MNTPVLKEIRIYPIKSLGGISLSEAVVEPKGFRYDRRWMLVKPDGTFLTQRENTVMALVEVELTDRHLRVYHRHRPDDVLEIPLGKTTQESLMAYVWDRQAIDSLVVSPEADAWFSRLLGFSCRLVYMPDDSLRPVDPKYAQPDDVVSFADGFPYLVISTNSLDELNRRVEQPLEMVRFRPNLVVEGVLPHDEDTWYHFKIGELTFYGVKPCARCVLTTIDPVSGQKGKEPLKTLATYRKLDSKILFGQNVLAETTGLLRVGDPVTILEQRPARLPFSH
ncbi:MOSC domain-containing protein [Larkinella punicea]|uniref:MOSC domain-containing protein n=1 Tax=Larkinella punicea TaxID=2315727 RepID=A0A368JG77_9BACT|nr:MOSC N-terminal beta barrel domain-containing protein [Larkinella punicea]RCR66542.1 MOSC domain-containing protein [Larkinella punicea]